MWVLARVAPRGIVPDRERSRQRRVTVVVATRELPAAIEARVRNVLDTEHPSEFLDVVVALDADGARATPADVANIDARVRALMGDPPGGKAAALNAGVRQAQGEILVMADTAQRFTRRTIPELVAALEDARFGAVSGALSLGGGEGAASPAHWYWALEKWLRYNEAIVHSSIGVTGAVYAVRRALWPVIPPGTLLDDVFVPMSVVLAGHRVGFVYSATAEDMRSFDAKAEGVRKERTLTGVLQLTRMLPDILSTRNPTAVQFVLHKLARLATPLLLMVMLVALTGWIALLAVQYPVPVAISAGSAVALAVVIPPLRRMVASGLRWGLSIQRATMGAVINGIRGRWRVWQKPG